jgi:hypothetical protein
MKKLAFSIFFTVAIAALFIISLQTGILHLSHSFLQEELRKQFSAIP